MRWDLHCAAQEAERWQRTLEDDNGVGTFNPISRAPWPCQPHGSGRLATSFGEVTCKDGFRCVSSTLKFGRNHVFGQDVTAPNSEDMEQDPDAEPTYEWNCPYRGSDGGTLWSSYKYSTGSGSDECEKANQDCMCISRQSADYKAELKDGQQIITGQFGIDEDGTVETPELAEMKRLRVIPHYAMRQLPESFNINDPHSNMGQIVTLPSKEFVDKWNMYAPLMQAHLDALKKNIEKAMKPAGNASGLMSNGEQASLAGQTFQCGDNGAMSLPEAAQLVGKIRRFQILSQDCETMRDNIGRTAPSAEQEQFDEKLGHRKLSCYKKHGAHACTQLNCYNAAVDAEFRRELAAFRHSLANCGVPEVDLTESNAQPPETAPAPQEQSLGISLSAGAVLMPPIDKLPVAPSRRQRSDLACPIFRRNAYWQLVARGRHFL